MEQEQLFAQMRKPEFYGLAADIEIEEIHTHISAVFLAADRVYKVKKPMNFGFLDFSDLAKREHFCRREVEFNRRLAGDVYREVLPIRQNSEGLAMLEGEPSQPIVEWCVVMNRLQNGRFLDQMLDQPVAVLQPLLQRALDQLARFYQGQNPDSTVRAWGSPEKVAMNLLENYDQTESVAGSLFDRVEWRWARETVERRLQQLRRVVAERQHAGYIVEAHGDLHAQHLWFASDDSPRFVDCIEFNERFRCIDVLSDLAFLYMDLVARGRTDLAQLVRRQALQEIETGRGSGGGSQAERTLLFDLYASYRAMVRAKVTGFLLQDPHCPADNKEKLIAEAQRYFALHARFLVFGTGMRVLLLSGPAASGKSTLARAFEKSCGLRRLSSDRTRKKMFGVAGRTRDRALIAQMYQEDISEKVYKCLLAMAAEELQHTGMAVLDATNLTAERRAPFEQLANAAEATITRLTLHVSDATIRERMVKRARSATSESDADYAVYRKQLDQYQPHPDALPIAAEGDNWAWQAVCSLASVLQESPSR